MAAKLITISVSHYCEKARWALQRSGVPFSEERHPPALHVLAAKRAGGGRTAPVLVAPDGAALADSTDILKWVDRQAAPEARLYPEDPAQRAEVERLEDRFDERLGPHTRRLAYYHLLDVDDLLPLLTDGVRTRERVAFRLGLPLIKRLMRKLMRIDAEGARRSEAAVEEVLGEVDGLLADGRRYLVGERFSAADLTFAALLAPLVVPPEYGCPGLPPVEELPPELRAVAERIIARPAGAFALRVYREERRAPVGATVLGT